MNQDQEAFYEERKHKAKSTMTRLVEYIGANPIPEGHKLIIAKSAVDKEFADATNLNRSSGFPEGTISGLNIQFQLGMDFHTVPKYKDAKE